MDLEYVPLGRTGLQVSELAFGTWRFGRETDQGTVEIGEDRAYELLDAYERAGGRFIDTADIYGDGDSETWIGNWLAERDRSDYVIASKVYWPTRDDNPNFSGLSRTHVRRQIDAILDRLGTEYLDLLYIHRWDGDTPAEQLMRTLNGLVDDGKVNFLGASTHTPDGWHVAKANEIADRYGFEPFTVSQPRYNLVNREVEAVAEEVEATPAQVSLAWLMHHQQVAAPIVGARTVEQLEENLGASDVTLSEEQFERLAESKPSPLDGI